MAETALYLALRKIRRTLDSLEDSSYYQILLPIFQSRLRRIESELRMILCFLDQLETRYSGNQVLVSWIAESQRLGYLVEETVDVYMHRRLDGLDGHWISRFLPSFLDQRRWIFFELTELEEELQHLSKLKDNWVHLATDPKRDHYYIPITCNVPDHELVYDFTDEELVGFDMERQQLTARLNDDEDSASKVVAVWGPAGSGKTALVRSVCEHERRYFEYYTWISMSGCSSAEHVLTTIHQELHSDDKTPITNPEHSAVRHDAVQQEGDTEQNPLQKKFLIVLDDMKVKDGIREVLKRIEQPRSQVIITTRIKVVAEVAEDRNRITLAGLIDAKAEELFGKVVSAEGKEVPKTLMDEYNKVMEKFPQCKSLPQVIVSLGATLRLNQSTDSAFQHVKNQLEWVSQYNTSLDDTRKCLYVAYINLPMHLKVCLLYCGIFPAGYLLQREKLVKLWVAEGFIKKQRESQVEEDIAEEYVIALTRWGFLQHLGSNEPGREEANVQMPIIVHNLVHSICRKEGFGIASEDLQLEQDDKNVRCLFTSKYPQDIGSLKHLPHLRTLLVSETGGVRIGSREAEMAASPTGYLTVLDLSPTGYLTVLDLHGSLLKYLPHGIGGLFNLRYLGLSKTKFAKLPSSISRLHNMQTLDLESTNIRQLPHWICYLVRLRHILAGRRSIEGVRASKGVMKKLKELQTLETVEASADFANNIGVSLTQIRSIGISKVDRKYSETLFRNLSRLGSLSSLAVSANNVDVILPVGSLNQKQLKFLQLSTCKLTEDGVKVLAGNLSNLVSLTLNNVHGITKLEFEQNWFTKLRALNLQKVHDMVTLKIAQGALKHLHVLHVKSCTKLDVNQNPDMVGFFQKKEVLATNDVPESSSRT